MAVALVALFIALGGSAFAASHYLINSPAQINPKVLKKLKGEVGPEGTKGLAGATGLAGPKGETGPEGKAGAKGETGAEGPKGEAGPKGETGPEGKAGPKGETGAEGPKGEAGTTSAGLSDSAAGPVALKAASEQTVATMSSVPVGNYMLSAKVTVENTAELETTIHCYLQAGGKAIDEASAYLGLAHEPGYIQSLPLTASQNFAATGTVTLTCKSEMAAVASNAQISAVQVQPLTHTTG
jgi:hypothetical protein